MKKLMLLAVLLSLISFSSCVTIETIPSDYTVSNYHGCPHPYPNPNDQSYYNSGSGYNGRTGKTVTFTYYCLYGNYTQLTYDLIRYWGSSEPEWTLTDVYKSTCIK